LPKSKHSCSYEWCSKNKGYKIFLCLVWVIVCYPHKNFRLRVCPLQASRQDMSRDAGKRGYCPSALWKGEAEVPFHNSITDNFIINIDLKQIYCSYSPTQKIQNVFFIIVFVVNIVDEQKQTKLVKFPLLSTLLLPLDMLMPDQEYLLRRMSMRIRWGEKPIRSTQLRYWWRFLCYATYFLINNPKMNRV